MRWSIGVLLLVIASEAAAQAPMLPPGLTDPGTKRWATRQVDSQRFFDDDTVAGPTFQPGDELLLIVTEGARVRVRKGDRYAWLPADAVTETAPAAPIDLLGPPTLAPGGGLQLSPGGGPPPLLPVKGGGGAGAGAGN